MSHFLQIHNRFKYQKKNTLVFLLLAIAIFCLTLLIYTGLHFVLVRYPFLQPFLGLVIVVLGLLGLFAFIKQWNETMLKYQIWFGIFITILITWLNVFNVVNANAAIDHVIIGVPVANFPTFDDLKNFITVAYTSVDIGLILGLWLMGSVVFNLLEHPNHSNVDAKKFLKISVSTICQFILGAVIFTISVQEAPSQWSRNTYLNHYVLKMTYDKMRVCSDSPPNTGYMYLSETMTLSVTSHNANPTFSLLAMPFGEACVGKSDKMLEVGAGIEPASKALQASA